MGPNHAVEALRMLEAAGAVSNGDLRDSFTAQAQVHATLAVADAVLAAAHIMAGEQ